MSAYKLNPAVMKLVLAERVRQRQLLADGLIKFDCASKIVSNDRKLRMATEELGEIARAIDKLENARGSCEKLKAILHLREELEQQAAVAIAWLESIEEELQ